MPPARHSARRRSNTTARGRMLIDQHDASLALAEEIAIEDLADEAQRRKPARCGRPERRLRRGRGGRRAVHARRGVGGCGLARDRGRRRGERRRQTRA